MSDTFKILAVAGGLSLFCCAYVFDAQDGRVADAQTFVRNDARVREAVGAVKGVYLMPLGKSLHRPPTSRMFLYVAGERGARMVQITSQHSYSGRVQNYYLDKDCHVAGF